MYCSIPIHGDNIKKLIGSDIFLPFDMIVCRPHIKVRASGGTFTTEKSSITHIKYRGINQGNDPIQAKDTYVVRYKVGCSIVNYEDVYTVPNAGAKRAESIPNKFYNHKKQISTKGDYYSIKNRKYGDGNESLFVVAVKYSEGRNDLDDKNMLGHYQYYNDDEKDRWPNFNFSRIRVLYGMEKKYGITNPKRSIDGWKPSKVNFSLSPGKYARFNHNSKNLSTLIEGHPFLKEKYNAQKF